MTTVSLSVGAPQPYAGGGEYVVCKVDVEGMPSARIAYCSIIARAAPGNVVDTGVGVAAFIHNGTNSGFAVLPFGPGQYTLFARLQAFDSSYRAFPSVDSADVVVNV